MIKAIIFDVGGVLELNVSSLSHSKGKKRSSIHSFMANKLHISIDQWFDSIDTAYAESIEGKISKQKALSIMANDLLITSKSLERLFIQGYRLHFKKNKTLFNLAFNLRKKDYKIAILSDQWHVSKEALMSSKEYKKFNISVVSCDVGLRKPNPAIYKLTLKKLKIKPEQALFIDNQIWNIKPAKKLGMKTILFRNNNQTIKDLKNQGIKI